MQNTAYKLLAAFIIVVFLFYWAISIPLAITKNGERNKLADAAPILNRFFGHTWNFFSGPMYNNDRMYIVLRNSITQQPADTLELLQDISDEKRTHAPFNQTQNIIDHLVNHNILIVENGIMRYRRQLKQIITNSIGSADNAAAFNMLRNDRKCKQALSTLENYGKMIVAQKNIDTTNKEFKIIIAAKSIRPFAQRNNENYVSKEAVYFETAYNNFGQ